MAEKCAVVEQSGGGWVMRIGAARDVGAILNQRRFGYLALAIFLFTQITDGVLTYIGVGTHGVRVEANPLATHLMATYGLVPAVTGIKVASTSMGFALYALGVPRILAAVALFYLVTAVLPWAGLLLLR